MQYAHLIRRNDHQRNMRGERSMEICVHRIVHGRARRLDQDETRGAQRTGNPGRNAVACHVPRVRQGVGVAEPARGREDGQAGRAKCGGRFGGIPHEHAAGQPRDDKVRMLVHRQHSHPVSRIIGEMELAIHMPHGVGKRTAAWDDEQAPRGSGVHEHRQHGIEVRRVGEQTSAELHDDVHENVSGLWSLVFSHGKRPQTTDHRLKTKDQRPTCD